MDSWDWKSIKKWEIMGWIAPTCVRDIYIFCIFAMMNRWVKLILLTLVMVLKGTVTMNAANIDVDSNGSVCAVVSCPNQKEQAVIHDSSQNYRVCSSRPSRTIPVNYFAKQDSRHVHKFLLFNFKDPIQRHHRQRNQISVSRMLPEPSCEYYVFALRRLLC